jgi:hypothetical protein
MRHTDCGLLECYPCLEEPPEVATLKMGAADSSHRFMTVGESSVIHMELLF